MSDDFAFEGSGQRQRNTWASQFPMAIWASNNPQPSGQMYHGWRIEADKYEDLDAELTDLGWPTVTILHGKRRVKHYDMSESGEFFLVARDYPQGRASDTDYTTRAGIAKGYNPNKNDDGKVIGSKIEVVAFYRPWVDIGVYKPILVTASRKFTYNKVVEGKSSSVSGLSVALGDHKRALAAMDELRKAKNPDARPAPFYALAMSAVPGEIVSMGAGENSANGMSIVSGHPATIDRNYLLERSLLVKQYHEFKGYIESMILDAVQWSQDRSAELDGQA